MAIREALTPAPLPQAGEGRFVWEMVGDHFPNDR
jgi:hypothetical protein